VVLWVRAWSSDQSVLMDQSERDVASFQVRRIRIADRRRGGGRSTVSGPDQSTRMRFLEPPWHPVPWSNEEPLSSTMRQGRNSKLDVDQRH
jgi:hypothetical protein